MKITMVTGVWKRPDVFKLFAKGVKAIPHEIDVIVAGSEGIHSRRMVESEGFTYIEKKNRPLGAKMNATTLAAKGSDYVICMGSDDILSPELFEVYLHYMNKGFDFIGLQDLYFYDTKSKHAIYWGGYKDNRKGKTTGVGRCLSKRMMELMDWQPWENKFNRYLDGSMDANISTCKSKKVINLKRTGLMAVDVKSKHNLTKFEKWHNADFIDPELIKEQFPYLP